MSQVPLDAGPADRCSFRIAAAAGVRKATALHLVRQELEQMKSYALRVGRPYCDVIVI
ncbi:MAG TPA: hypothetical protein VKB35_05450 [Ktedonobacteraceae bacterium]|nr:hypothetical protein [Ktedonobacteraceae bacterium]